MVYAQFPGWLLNVFSGMSSSASPIGGVLASPGTGAGGVSLSFFVG